MIMDYTKKSTNEKDVLAVVHIKRTSQVCD